MKPLVLTLCAAALLSLFSCNDSVSDKQSATASGFSLDSVKAQITASNALYGRCFANNDSATFLNCYTNDACINPPNLDRICGRKGIAAFFRGGYQMGVRDIQLTTEEVVGGKEGVIETGSYELFGDSARLFEKGKFMVLWKEENGKWKMHRDQWSSNAPLTAPK